MFKGIIDWAMGNQNVLKSEPIDLHILKETRDKESKEKLDKKREAAISYLGEKWILHPNNKVTEKVERQLSPLEKSHG